MGAGQIVWILLELVFLPEATWLQAVYGGRRQLALAAAPALGAPLPCFTYGTFGRTQGSAGPHDEGRHRHHAGNGNRRAHHR